MIVRISKTCIKNDIENWYDNVFSMVIYIILRVGCRDLNLKLKTSKVISYRDQ
nr:hypothetical protein [Mucilaginibacter sp. X4EP1]